MRSAVIGTAWMVRLGPHMRCRNAGASSKVSQWLLRLLVGEPLSADERRVTESIRALKTLNVIQGRVSIDPSEVLDYPGYLESRQRAAEWVRRVRR